jgi:hypothetical protein
MTRDEHDGCIEAPLQHALLQSEAIHARHLDVEHHAPGLLRRAGLEIGSSRVERPSRVARRPEEPGQRRANARVVVHHLDRNPWLNSLFCSGHESRL